MALHKMSRLLTFSLSPNGYLNFMGNEFGHPEWIDFPRPGNGNSFHYCRRQWSLMRNPDLKYQYLYKFDQDMIAAAKKFRIFDVGWPTLSRIHEDQHVLAFERNGLLFAFNFDPTTSYTDYEIPVTGASDYQIVFSSDDWCYGGYGRNARDPIPCMEAEKKPEAEEDGKDAKPGHYVKLYLPARTALVLCLAGKEK